MSIRYPGRASISPRDPEAVGRCDRCGFLYNLRELRYQPVYAGPGVLVTRLRVCDRCQDNLNPQQRTIRISPDPLPVPDPRFENFAIDEQNFLDLKAIIGKPSMFLARSSMQCELEVGEDALDIEADFVAASAISAALQYDARLVADMTAVSELSAALQRDVNQAVAFEGVSVMDAGLKRIGSRAAPTRRGRLYQARLARGWRYIQRK